MFDTEGHNVALVRKAKPAWMRGWLNAIGGKVEPNESAIEAMVREFGEETGVFTTAKDWIKVNTLKAPGYKVVFYATVGDLSQLKSTTAEEIVVHAVSDIDDKVVPNVQWLLPMARTRLFHPHESTVQHYCIEGEF